jgi:hypothetical protein
MYAGTISAALDAQPPNAAPSATIPRIRMFDVPPDKTECLATRGRGQAESRDNSAIQVIDYDLPVRRNPSPQPSPTRGPTRGEGAAIVEILSNPSTIGISAMGRAKRYSSIAIFIETMGFLRLNPSCVLRAGLFPEGRAAIATRAVISVDDDDRAAVDVERRVTPSANPFRVRHPRMSATAACSNGDLHAGLRTQRFPHGSSTRSRPFVIVGKARDMQHFCDRGAARCHK